jgi:CheY-like chemotaxis protein
MIQNSCSVLEKSEPPPPNGAEAPEVGVALSTGQAEAHGSRVLLVEDQALLRESLRTMLEFDGHQVTEAGNGAEALNLFKIAEFDLVITDLEMPVMKGDKLAVKIRSLAPSLPILMITASERARVGPGNPVDALLNKPLRVADLRGALGKLLSVRPSPAQPSTVLA